LQGEYQILGFVRLFLLSGRNEYTIAFVCCGEGEIPSCTAVPREASASSTNRALRFYVTIEMSFDSPLIFGIF
jgi:hypothetical protein